MSTLNVVAKPGEAQLEMARVFDAPRELVFKAYTDATLVPRWWGPRYLTTTVDKLEARSGGSWRFVQRAPNRESRFLFLGHCSSPSPVHKIIDFSRVMIIATSGLPRLFGTRMCHSNLSTGAAGFMRRPFFYIHRFRIRLCRGHVSGAPFGPDSDRQGTAGDTGQLFRF